MLIEADVTRDIITAAIAVHRELGPGILESAYATCLARELELRDIPFQREVPLALEYRGLRVANAYRADFIIADRVIVEVKAVEAILPQHVAQLLTYLRLSGYDIGLLLNFNAPTMKEGIRRLVRPGFAKRPHQLSPL